MFLSIKNLNKYFGNNHVLNNVSTDLKKGEVMSIIGPSGSGKSTFLKCINFLEYPASGSVNLNGEYIGFNQNGKLMSENIIHKQRKKFGMVFQNFNLFWHMNLIENIIEAPIRVLKIEKNKAISIAEDLLEKVGLIDKRFNFPKKLSGGQQQRGAIARALAMNPEVMLFDEPTSALDPETINEVLKVIEKLASDGMSMLIVTHEINFAKKISNRIMMLDEGKIVDDTDTDSFFSSTSNKRKFSFLNQGH
jgi:ABC-type polar amino acid transport system ATPase subunit